MLFIQRNSLLSEGIIHTEKPYINQVRGTQLFLDEFLRTLNVRESAVISWWNFMNKISSPILLLLFLSSVGHVSDFWRPTTFEN